MRRLVLALGLLVMTSPLWAQVSKNFTWINATQYADGTAMAAANIKETRVSIAPTAGGSPSFVVVATGSVTGIASLPIFTAGAWFARAQHVDNASGTVGQPSTPDTSFTVGTCQANPLACTPRPPTNLQVQ